MSRELRVRSDSKILVIRLFGIGETVMFGPTLKCLRQNFPNANIHLLTGNVLKDFFSNSGLVNKVIGTDENLLVKKNILYVTRLLVRIRKEKYDLVITAHPNLWCSLFTFLLNADNTIGFDYNKRGIFYKYRVKSKLDVRPRQFLKLLSPLGIENGNLAVFPFYKSIHLKEMGKYVLNIKDEGFFPMGLCPGGARNPRVNFSLKRWPLENYLDLVNILLANHKKIKVIIFGGKTDKNEADKFVERFGDDIMDFTGKLTITETQALMSFCDCIVSNDTGLLHLAVSSGAYVYGIYGPTMPETCYESGILNVIKNKVECAPCCPEDPKDYPFKINSECKESLKCLYTISPEIVYERLKERLISGVF